MKRRRSVLIGFIVTLSGAWAAASAPAGAIPASACTRPIVISRLAFGPGTVVPGGQSTARLSGMNCTKHVQSANIQWEGQFTGPNRTGCPIIDPFPASVSVPAHKQLKAQVTYLVPNGCSAKSLVVTARVTDKAGKRIANKTATLRIAHTHMSGT
jgi:hypothetical protein